jgi:mannose-1-phosphate guanylyltransferase
MPIKKKKPNKDRFAVILAGGKGERFWPLSREKSPKQLLALFDKKSFLQHTVERMKPLLPMKNIYVITSQAQVQAVKKQLPKIPKDNIIAEPCGRDTCPAVALAAALVGARSTTAAMAILPADHLIPLKSEKKFQKILEESYDLAGRGQAIITIGIKPTEPETGYGYIKMGDVLPAPKNRKAYKTSFHVVRRFVEKPNLNRALQYLNDGNYRWNAGMFVFSFPTITESLLKHQKPLYDMCQKWFQAASSPLKLRRILSKDYPNIKKVSFDYGIMEHASNVLVADGNFHWDDLGAWPALARHLKPDAEGNCAEADFIHVDAARNVVFDARNKKNRKPIAVVGLRDCVIVQTDDTTLIAHKRATVKMRDLVSKLSAHRSYKHLV